MGAGDDAEQEEAMLRVRALQLSEIARTARVMAGTFAERDLERVRAEIAEVIAALDGSGAPYWANADRLKGIAGRLGYALSMGGINAADAPPLNEVQSNLANWIESASGA